LQQAFEKDGLGLRWRGDGTTLSVQPWGKDAVRVRSRLMADVIESNWALLDQPEDQESSVELKGDEAVLEVGSLRVILRQTAMCDGKVGYETFHCSISFEKTDGTPLLRERDRGGSLDLKARDLRPVLGGDISLTMSFESPEEEHLWGMGQYQEGIGDLKGSTLELAHRNSQASVPFVISSKGYGFLWHNPAIGQVSFSSNVTQWSAERCDQLDYWITAGDSPREISKAYAAATGFAPMMPEHGLGFWQCKLRYWNQEQLLEVAREHKRRGLPLDVIVIDFFHWPHMGDYRFEEEFWPDPQAMVDELHSMGVELMVSVWTQVAHASENWDELKKNNLLARAERGLDVHMAFQGPSAFIDMTNPEARKFIWEKCKENYGKYGIKIFWLDEAEPEYGAYDFDNYRYNAGPNVKVGNIYPQNYAKAFYDGLVESGTDDVVNLLRCAWAGSQRYGALVWSGDISSTWKDLRCQVAAGIHMGAAGIPWWTTDIGGFHDGVITDPKFKELLIRWFQFGAFCPVMRLHGDRRPVEEVSAKDGSYRLPSGAENELWSFGDDVYAVLEKYIHLREKLRDYMRDVMLEAHEEGQPVMRGLFQEFPLDEKCWSISDQYLLGGDILVAPVLEAAATSRSVYLPAGASWTDASTGDKHEGGQSIDVECPLDKIPVFFRDDTHSELVGMI